MKMNRFILSIAAAVTMLLPFQAGARDKVPAGAVKVSDIDVAHTDNNFFVNMKLDLSGYKGMNHNREVLLTPRLVNGADTLDLPSLTVAGRDRYYLWYRQNKAKWPSESLYRAGKTAQVDYRTSVEYQPWMATSRLEIKAREFGCCGQDMAQENIPVEKFNLVPPEFKPFYAFVQPKAELVKHREIKGQAYIDFPVNRTELYPDYRRNPQELAKIRATIDSVRLDKDVQIKALDIKGYASPEGPYDNNVRLAKGRTATLKEYVLNQYAFPSKIITTSYEPEDWEGLRRYVEKSNLENKDAILALIDSDMKPDPKNTALQTRFPRQYDFLLKEVYPGLRHSDYKVEFTVKNYTDMAEIKRLLFSAPQKLSLAEMFAAAATMEPASPEYAEAFQIAVRMYPDSKDANLNAANVMMQQGQPEQALRYLDKAGDSPEATYARGLYAAFTGDYDRAAELIGKAKDAGVKGASDALEQIDKIVSFR